MKTLFKLLVIISLSILGACSTTEEKELLVITKTGQHSYNIYFGNEVYENVDEEELDCFILNKLDPLANFY